LTAIDLFAGAGGATQGLIDAGITVVGAVEFDQDAAATYRLNHPGVKLWEEDIKRIPATAMARELNLKRGALTLLKACPPCQGFSSLAEGRGAHPDDPRNDLVLDVVRFVRVFAPQLVLMENVRGLGRDPRSQRVEASLRRLGYATKTYIVNAADFGVPQKRTRFILLAARGRKTVLPDRLDDSSKVVRTTVRTAFSEMEKAVAEDDELHAVRPVNDLVRLRIEAIPVGGNRFDLPTELQLACHQRLDQADSRAAAGSYARLKWDEPAPTMTTRCTTPACGPFVHPDKHRPITLREAATIQTFPIDYAFVGSRGAIERQIGNAVPVKMAKSIAATALDLIGGLRMRRDQTSLAGSGSASRS
jgi:DNA (cytosine-5)-methyltransferase 1